MKIISLLLHHHRDPGAASRDDAIFSGGAIVNFKNGRVPSPALEVNFRPKLSRHPKISHHPG